MDREGLNNARTVRRSRSIGFLSLCVLAGFLCVLGRAWHLQVIEHEEWVEKGQSQHAATAEVPLYRGSISDAGGKLLAYSVPQPSLFADCTEVKDPSGVAAKLAPILGEPRASLERKLASGRRFLWIKRQLSDSQAQGVSALKISGLHIVNEYKRFYPSRHLAGQVVGFVGLDGVGLEGVEKMYDTLLRGASYRSGQIREGGRTRRTLWMDADRPPEPDERLGLRLTIDSRIQYAAERELEKVMEKYKARAGEIVVMDVRDFTVLAMANAPFFDPNSAKTDDAELWKNHAIADIFEPGSTFKVFLMAAALETGVVKERDKIFCENGKYRFAGHTINDVHPRGTLTMAEVIKYSSNVGAAKIAGELGAERFHRYLRAFGFGGPTGIALPGEARGIVRPWKTWRPIDLAVTGFGQSVGVTGLQLTAAVAAIASGGKAARPRIAKGVVDAEGNFVKQFETEGWRQAIRPETAAKVRDMMVLVCQEGGTGTEAAIPGYTVAGKTGTAQVVDPETGRYAKNKHGAIFTGFVPAENPVLAISVVIHEPKGAMYGGVVAAPAFREIAAKALPYLGVPPAPIEHGPLPGARLAQAAGKSQSTQGAKVQTAPAPHQGKVREVSAQPAAPVAKGPSATTPQPRVALSAPPLQAAAAAPQIRRDAPAPAQVPPQIRAAAIPQARVQPIAAGASGKPGLLSVATAEAGTAPPPPALMPDLSGLSLRAALAECAKVGLSVKFRGAGRVVRQQPAPGTTLAGVSGAELVLEASR